MITIEYIELSYTWIQNIMINSGNLEIFLDNIPCSELKFQTPDISEYIFSSLSSLFRLLILLTPIFWLKFKNRTSNKIPKSSTWKTRKIFSLLVKIMKFQEHMRPCLKNIEDIHKCIQKKQAKKRYKISWPDGS